jgi:hypothetical protein
LFLPRYSVGDDELRNHHNDQLFQGVGLGR